MDFSAFFEWIGWGFAGTAFSIAGLILSGLAALFAKSAKSAAQQAVQRSERIDIAASLNQALEVVRHVRTLVQTKDWKFASYLARELQANLSSIDGSKSFSLSEDDDQRFRCVCSEIESLANSLERSTISKDTRVDTMTGALGKLLQELAYLQKRVKDDV
ncbi:hypothetical protein KBY29_06745 [Ruegeria pomeroyi]|nr:hypothetical protein [Ruegeria pomeroyi]